MSVSEMTAADRNYVGSAADRLHIVHGVLSLELGGLERLVVDLVRIGCQRGHRLSVVCIERAGRLAAQARELGAQVFSLDKPPGRSSIAIEQAAGLLRNLQPDVIHTHQIGAVWHLGQAARREGVPVVHTEHSDHVAHANGWWNKMKNRLRWHWNSQRTDRFCCVSEDVARSVMKWGTVPWRKVDVVLNGIDTSRYTDRSKRGQIRSLLGIPAEAHVIGTVGRLTEIKRQDLLLRAVARLRMAGAQQWLLIVGDGPQRLRLKSLSAELGIANHTVLAGYQAHPEWYLQAMDLFALTSRHEGLPLALLEAWAAGLPVVSSAVGGIPEIVQHGRTGLLFASGDEEALVNALGQLLDDSVLTARLAAAGRAMVQERFSLARMADDYERHYRAVIAAN